MIYSGQKKDTLLKSHQVGTADGRRAFYTMGGGDVDDQTFLASDLKNPDSQLSKLISKALELKYTPVIVLDGGYWEQSKEAVQSAGAVAWLKDNSKQRQSRDVAQSQDAQMVGRSAVERSNFHNTKGFGALRKPLGFHDIFRIEDMMAISLAVGILKDRPLARSTGGLSRHQFGDISDADLRAFETTASFRSKKDPWIKPSLLPSVLETAIVHTGETNADIHMRDVASNGKAAADSDAEEDSADDASESADTSIFSRTTLSAWMSKGRVERGHSYAALNWIYGIRMQAIKNDNLLVVAKAKRSLKQTPAYNLVMVLRGKKSQLADVKTRCECLKGRSGQCGHVVGLALTLWRLASPRSFENAFKKNPHGKHQKTVEDLQQFLEKQPIHKSVATAKKESSILGKKGDPLSSIVYSLTSELVETSALVRKATAEAKQSAQMKRGLRASDKEKNGRRRTKKAEKGRSVVRK